MKMHQISFINAILISSFSILLAKRKGGVFKKMKKHLTLEQKSLLEHIPIK